VTAAPALPTPVVVAQPIELLAREPMAGGVRIRLRLHLGEAEAMTLIAPPGAPLLGAGSNGFVQRFGTGQASDRFFIRCVGRSCDGAELSLILARAAPVTFTVTYSRSGLPPSAAALVQARGPLARPQYGPDATIFVDTFHFDGTALTPPPPPT
jgi:hypothetical protein